VVVILVYTSVPLWCLFVIGAVNSEGEQIPYLQNYKRPRSRITAAPMFLFAKTKPNSLTNQMNELDVDSQRNERIVVSELGLVLASRNMGAAVLRIAVMLLLLLRGACNSYGNACEFVACPAGQGGQPVD
jgi:hypothetical protein